MHLGQPANQKVKLWILGISAVLAFLFLISFWFEIGGVLRLFWGIFLTFLGFPFKLPNTDIFKAVSIVSFNCFVGFGAVFFIWLFLISWQAILPVQGLQQVYRTAWHLWLYMRHNHGPALFIRDGMLTDSPEELNRPGHGVVSVDFNSAVVIEERDAPPGLTRLIQRFMDSFLHIVWLSDAADSVRVCGPGITFIRPRERIRGVVDLRRQFRIQMKVPSYSREGIELTSNIFAIFTIGQDPDVLQVGYVGDRRPENLRVLTLKPVPGKSGYLHLAGIADELDEKDREEIHNRYLSMNAGADLFDYQPIPEPSSMPTFNQERVFAAVFAQARNGEQETLPWTELPTRVAAGFYREIMPTINYDELYDIRGIQNGSPFPMQDFKAKMRIKMRNNGILSYRLVFLRSNRAFVKSMEYPVADITVSEARPLTNSKMLRDRGIKIIVSNFGDPTPASPAVYKQRLDAWRATWDRDLSLTLANRELEALRVKSRAHADAQQDLWYALSELFARHEYTDEALALRILQALERAAADPTTRQLLPTNTLQVMQQMHGLLIPADLRNMIVPGGLGPGPRNDDHED